MPGVPWISQSHGHYVDGGFVGFVPSGPDDMVHPSWILFLPPPRPSPPGAASTPGVLPIGYPLFPYPNANIIVVHLCSSSVGADVSANDGFHHPFI